MDLRISFRLTFSRSTEVATFFCNSFTVQNTKRYQNQAINGSFFLRELSTLSQDFVTPFQKQNILKFLRDEMIKNSYLNSDSREILKKPKGKQK